ncbi:MAG: carboxymuconolactone decarboxylase family protein [Terriglobia bacterium]
MSDEELQRLETGDLEKFSPRERAALEFGCRLTKDSNLIGDNLFNELRQHFNEGEIVEIATVAGLFNYFNRVNNALQMEPTR